MKNFVKEGQKLPLYGIGPYLVYGMAAIALAGILLSGNLLKSGILEGAWILIFRVIGAIIIAEGVIVWVIGALGSGMDDIIASNKLKTDGIYGCVRNPMYSGLWLITVGIGLMWHNAWLLLPPVINWIIMTFVLQATEEKWLLNLYGKEYEEYIKKVNRCIPWFSK